MFNGRNLRIDLEVNFAEVMQEGGCTKQITADRDTLCKSCKGSRENSGSQSLQCYSCKGKGIKLDAIFQKETRCNTCKGHGKLI